MRQAYESFLDTRPGRRQRGVNDRAHAATQTPEPGCPGHSQPGYWNHWGRRRHDGRFPAAFLRVPQDATARLLLGSRADVEDGDSIPVGAAETILLHLLLRVGEAPARTQPQ